MKKADPIARERAALLHRALNGNKRSLAAAAVAIIFVVAAAYVTPLIVSFSVDYIIGNEQGGLPGFVTELLAYAGGREFLRSHLYICAAALALTSLIGGAATHLRGRFAAKGAEGVAKNLRDELYCHLSYLPYDYHKHSSTGDLVQRCTSDVDTVRRFISMQLLEVVRTLLMVAIAAGVMFSIDTRMALICMALLPLLGASSFFYFRRITDQFAAADEAEGRLSAALQENLTGVRVVRAFAQQKSEVEKFTARNADYRQKSIYLMNSMALYWGSSDFVGYMQIALALFAGVTAVVRGELTLGELLIFSSYTAMLTWPVRQLGRVLSELGKARISLTRLADITSHAIEAEPGRALELKIRGRVEFRSVCFGYDSFDDVLSNISFTAEPGETVAILGATGSGKTSLVQLLQRLYTATRGEILIDGVNINDIAAHSLRSQTGIVLQEPFLYSRTIMENIRITRPDASDEEVFAAARTASVHDVIESFDEGYGTIVGERGVTLSGGQKQRVAIARMLMQHAPILIFDDSLSAVDTETDAAIRSALRRAKNRQTTFIISHRIATLMEADTILVLENGSLAEIGTHAQLMAKNGLYRRIAEIQDMTQGGDLT